MLPCESVVESRVGFRVDSRGGENIRVVIGDDGIHRTRHDVTLAVVFAHREERSIVIGFEIQNARVFGGFVIRLEIDDAVFRDEIIIETRVGVKRSGALPEAIAELIEAA